MNLQINQYRMKRLLFILLILMRVEVSAQIPVPVQWEFSHDRLELFIPVIIVFIAVVWFFNDKIKAR